MTTFFAKGGAPAVIDPATQLNAVRAAIEAAGDCSRTLVLPPDATRFHSQAGPLTDMIYGELAPRAHVDVMPALGTHFAMTMPELRRMFGPRIPAESFLVHNWRDDLKRLGSVPADYVHQVSDGCLRESMPDFDVPVEINRCLVDGGYSAILSVGQVVPHEVIGMANGVKNVLVGAGGRETINRTHFLGAAYGMERIMGRSETPVRSVMNYGAEHYLADLPVLYILTVMGRDDSGDMVMRGIFVGDDHATFLKAARLSQEVNLTFVEEAPERVVAFLDPEEFKSTWLGNKAVYRTRMLIADGGELLIIGPGVHTFGEDPEIDRLVRRYGYKGTPATLAAVAEHEELRDNLSAAAHLVHGSSEGRFRIVLATDPDKLSPREVESVGFEWRDVSEVLAEYDVDSLEDGPQPGGFYYISNPALGLWAERSRFGE